MVLDELEKLRAEAKKLKEVIQEARLIAKDISMEHSTRMIKDLPPVALRVRRTLMGHIGKVYALHWGLDSRQLVSAAQDRRLILWDSRTGQKGHTIDLPSVWIMTCAFAHSGKFVVSGGVDRICSVFAICSGSPFNLRCELKGHKSYVSSCRYINNHQLVSSSGDKTAILWDVFTGQLVSVFEGHTRDVLSLDLWPVHHTFVTASCDAKAKLWDIRMKHCCQTFEGHTSDINTVTFLPTGNAFITGSDDTTCRLFDIRADQELAVYEKETNKAGITSVAASKSGRIFFTGNDCYIADVWDSLKNRRVGILDGHRAQVSCLGIPCDSSCVSTGSWDTTIKLWS